MKKLLQFLTVLTFSLSIANAAPFTITYPDFQPGTDIIADEVDTNNADIVTEINALTGERIVDGTLTDVDLAPDSVTEPKIVDDAVHKEHIYSDVAGDGLGQTAGALIVKVDDVTIETNADALRLKDGGITGVKVDSTTTISIAGLTSSGNIVLDDGVGDSPFILIKDASNDQAVISKLNSGPLFIFNEDATNGEIRFATDGHEEFEHFVIDNDGTNVVLSTMSDAGTCDLYVQPDGGDVVVTGKTTTDTFQITTGATDDYILKSDASGNASWVDVGTVPSSLGEGCRVILTNDMAIPTNTVAPIIFDDSDATSPPGYDDESYHDYTTNPSRVTIPTSGRYRITGQLRIATLDDGTQYRGTVKKNNAVVDMETQTYASGTDDYLAINFSSTLDLVNSDYIELFVQHTNGDTQTMVAYKTWFEVIRVK